MAGKLKLATGTISEEPFKLLVQSILDYAIYLLDPNGFVTSWNAGAERIKGFQTDEIVGQHFSKFYTEEDRKAGMVKVLPEPVTPRSTWLASPFSPMPSTSSRIAVG